MRLLISAGGTGGHIYPALAIVKKFQEKEKNLEVLYIGTHNRMENTIVPEHNIPFKSIKIYGFSKNIGTDLKNIGYLYKAYRECLKITEEFSPDVVIGVGGYVTLPVIMAARAKKIKTYIHEQNSIPGKTNKFLSRGVTGVFTSFKGSEKYFSKGVNCIYTGNPCSDNVSSLKPMAKEKLGFKKNKKLVLVVAGSLGSSALNEKLKEFLQLSGGSDYEVLYITGNSNYEEFIKNNHFSSNIKVIPYLDNLASLLKSCDLIISRAGAGITSEVIAAKVPAILIPSPNVANNHQYYNALDLKEHNLALMLEEKDLTSKELHGIVESLLDKDNGIYKVLKGNLDFHKNTSASEEIYKIIKENIKC